jgi:hypothetical protein
MNFRIHPSVAWTLAVLAAFTAGYLIGGSASPQGEAVSHPSVSKGKDSGGSTPTGSGSAGIKHIKSTGIAVGEAAIAVLSEPNRLRRLDRIVELLPSIDAENWREAMDGFTLRRDDVGRPSPEELKLILGRIGEVGGSSAIEQTLKSELPDAQERAVAITTGWAAADPKAASAWFRAQPHEVRDKLLDGVISGLAASSSADVLALWLPLSLIEQSRTSEHLLESTIQRGGFAAADELMATAFADPKTEWQIKRRLAELISRPRSQASVASRQPLKALAWLEPYLGAEWLDTQTFGNAAHGASVVDPAITMTWLDAHSNRYRGNQEVYAYQVAAGNWYRKDADQFRAWALTHKEHPQMREIVYSLANMLIGRGDAENARRLTGEIATSSARAGFERAVSNQAAIQQQRQQAAEARARLDQAAPAAQ